MRIPGSDAIDELELQCRGQRPEYHPMFGVVDYERRCLMWRQWSRHA